MDAEQVIIFGNPKAGARSGKTLVQDLSGELVNRGYVVDVIHDPHELAEVTHSNHADRDLRVVVSAGGDGTAQLVVNKTPPGTPITVLPLGTENLLAKYLGLKTDVPALADVIQRGHTRQLDAGKEGERIFLLMLSCGFDAEVVRRVHEERTGHIHHLSYAKPIIDSIRKYGYPELRVVCDTVDDRGEPVTTTIKSHWAFVFNLPAYAAGLRIAPDANPSDGQLDICTFVGGSLPAGLFHLGTIMLGQHGQWSDCMRVTATRVRIESDRDVPVQVDGDPAGVLPVEVEIVPDRLVVMVPER